MCQKTPDKDNLSYSTKQPDGNLKIKELLQQLEKVTQQRGDLLERFLMLLFEQTGDAHISQLAQLTGQRNTSALGNLPIHYFAGFQSPDHLCILNVKLKTATC